MDNQDIKMVTFDSDEAAQYKTNLSGWVSRQGYYWGNDERAARYDGCTHVICEDCGEPCEKGWLVCKKCREIRDVKKYNDMPKEKWDGKGMLYSGAVDKYFIDWDDVDEYCEEEGIKKEELRLVICEGQSLPLLNGDYGIDVRAEDDELPDAVIQAIEDFNKVIEKVGIVSWFPGKKAAIYE